MLIAPLASFVLAVSSIRTRRSASTMAMFGTVVMLAATVLVGWGLTRKGGPYMATYQYMTLSVAFSGPANFQSFAIELVLRADRITVAALSVIEICVLGALGWHQVMGRTEPGAARFNALVTGLLFSCAGILMSWDLAELFAFWALAAGMTYLLLAHRWGQDEPARRAGVALALPFLTDISLLCGIGWLYARYGAQNLNNLLPILHSNPGWTVRSLVVASVLLFIGIAGRLALWPLNAWISQTAVSAPPAASAIAQSAWSVVAIVVLYRVMPIFAASNHQTLQACIAACAVAAVAAPLLALLGNEPRRIITLLGSGVTAAGTAVVIRGLETPRLTFAVAGIACVFAAAPARAGATLAISSIAAAIRTDDLAEMGDAWRRMRTSSVALLLSAIVLALSALGALAFGVGTRSWLGVALGDAVLLVAVGALRVFLASSFGPLQRRRAFEPDRVREAASGSLGWPYLLAVAGGVFLVLSLSASWLNFLDTRKHPVPDATAFAIWAAAAIIGFAAAAFAYLRAKDSALRFSAVGGAWLTRAVWTGTSVLDRFLIRPTSGIIRALDEWIPEGDGALGRFASTAGRLGVTASRAPALPLIVLLAVVLAFVVALAAPGVLR